MWRQINQLKKIKLFLAILPSKKGHIKLCATLVVLLFLAIFTAKTPAYAHSVECWGTSYDWKGSNGRYMYAAATQCREEVYYAGVNIRVQSFDWQENKWKDLILNAMGGDYNTNFYQFASALGVYVPPYHGINCRRIRTIHGVVHDNQERFFTTYSGGQCY